MPARKRLKAAEDVDASTWTTAAASAPDDDAPVATCELRTTRPDDKTWSESVALVQVRDLTNCSKAAKRLALVGEMVASDDCDVDADADADADGDDDDDVASREANVPCCNSPKRE